jgi:hypothetical protein
MRVRLMPLEGSSLSTLTMRARRSRAILIGVSTLVLALVVPAQAPAAQLASATVSADGGSGDWDVAIFAGDTLVAGSAYRGSEELAEGLVTAGADLTVQACRLSGGGDSASLTVESIAVDTTSVQKASLVKVSTPTRERKNELNSLGLDVTEHGGENFLDVVLHGPADAATLTARNFMFITEVADLAVQSKSDRQADPRRSSRPG